MYHMPGHTHVHLGKLPAIGLRYFGLRKPMTDRPKKESARLRICGAALLTLASSFRLLVLSTCATLMVALTGCAAYQNISLAKDGPGAEFSAAELKTFRESQDMILNELFVLAQVNTTTTRTTTFSSGTSTDQKITTVSEQIAVAQISKENWDSVISAGMDYADTRCEAYMHALFRLNRNRKTATSEIGLVGAATAGVLAATKAAAKEVAIVAIMFGLANSTIDNLSSNLLYELDPSSIRSLVKTLQLKYRQGLPMTGYTSRPAAISVIRGYAALCLPSNIESEVNIAVKKAEPATAPGDTQTGRPPAVSNSDSIVGTFTARADNNTALLLQYVFPGGQLNTENRKRLEDYLRQRKIDVDVSSFARLARFAQEREEAATVLKLK